MERVLTVTATTVAHAINGMATGQITPNAAAGLVDKTAAALHNAAGWTKSFATSAANAAGGI